MAEKKIFILDTNVLLHDFRCLYNFMDNDVVIPIVALEELDKFKKGNDQINFHAREFMRELDKLSEHKLINGGVKLGKNKGKLWIETGKPFSTKMLESFHDKSPDNRILSIAEHLHIAFGDRYVSLVTKDINLRIKAKSIGLNSEDYKSDKVKDLDTFHKNVETIEIRDDSLIARLYNEREGVPVKDFKLKFNLKGHQYSILKGQNSSALVHHNPLKKTLEHIDKRRFYGIEPRNAEQAFAFDALMRPEVELVSITGKAGTGKTLLALAAALQQESHFHQILLARPIVSLSNKDLGYLPGDVKEKIGPYMMPLFDNLSVIKNRFKPQSPEFNKIEEMLKTEKLLISPLAYIRGRSLSNVFFIIDEAQNLTPHEIKTIITRAGEGTKLVFTGDIYQIDTPYLDILSNGLSYLTDKMVGQDIFAHIKLVKGERSHLAELASNLL